MFGFNRKARTAPVVTVSAPISQEEFSRGLRIDTDFRPIEDIRAENARNAAADY
jgi:hypothetical protein